jgi:transcriptional regulator with XRE-family HTH domain
MDATLGARLRTQRENKNVTLSAIAEKTKINVALLEGLECDDVSRWPSGIFRRGYIRSYAEAIELDPEPIVREFLDLHPDPGEDIPAAVDADASTGARPPTRIQLLLSQARRLCSTRFVGHPWDATQHSSSTAAVRDPIVQRHASAAGAPSTASEAVRHERVAPNEGAECLGTVQPTTTAPRVRRAATNAVPRADDGAMERKLIVMGRLFTVLGCCREQQEIATVLEEAAGILDAQGVVLWMSDSMRTTLYPVLAAGYAEDVLKEVSPVRRNSGTAVASAFRAGQVRVVRSAGEATGALVAPLLTPGGCVGVLACEFADGVESRASVRALVTILSAQLSTVVRATPARSRGQRVSGA